MRITTAVAIPVKLASYIPAFIIAPSCRYGALQYMQSGVHPITHIPLALLVK